MICYCFSGLGADSRVFKNIEVEGLELVPLDWIKPKDGEGLDSFAIRMLKEKQTDSDFALMGVSFGGMLAIEAAKIFKPAKLILISTILSVHESPFTLKCSRVLQIQRWIPVSLLLQPNAYMYFVFGVSKRRHVSVLKNVMNEVDPEFFKWALGAILKWKNSVNPENYIRLHGAKDRLIPVPKNYKGHMIKSAGHFMIRTHWRQINEAINRHLS